MTNYANLCITRLGAAIPIPTVVDIKDLKQSLDMLITDSIELIQYAKQNTAKQVNLVQLMTYYSFGKWVVEEQQEGKERAKYGK